MVRILKLFSLGTFQVYNTVLFAIITTPHTRSPEELEADQHLPLALIISILLSVPLSLAFLHVSEMYSICLSPSDLAWCWQGPSMLSQMAGSLSHGWILCRRVCAHYTSLTCSSASSTLYCRLISRERVEASRTTLFPRLSLLCDPRAFLILLELNCSQFCKLQKITTTHKSRIAWRVAFYLLGM